MLQVFHAKVLNKKRWNRIFGVFKDDGIWSAKMEGIKQVFGSFFRTLFDGNLYPHVNAGGFSFNVHSNLLEDSFVLIDIPSMDEIRKVVFAMKPEKTLGPDGLPPVFFQQLWPCISQDLKFFLRHFVTAGSLPWGINHTIITLIPKIQNPRVPDQYRPISICNVLQKIVTKTLALRVKHFMPRLISDCQAAFVPGCLGLDNIIIMKEIMNAFKWKWGKHGWFMAKLDIHKKAYDSLKWDFIRNMLVCFKFPVHFINLVMECITTVTDSINLNGFIIPSRGIRQDCPLSPYIYILCAEALTCLLNNAIEDGKLSGISIYRRGKIISHLMYADDLIICGSANETKIKNLKKVLGDYENQSG